MSGNIVDDVELRSIEITSFAFRRSTDDIKESIYAGHHVFKRPRAWRLISLLCERIEV